MSQVYQPTSARRRTIQVGHVSSDFRGLGLEADNSLGIPLLAHCVIRIEGGTKRMRKAVWTLSLFNGLIYIRVVAVPTESAL